MAVLVINRTVYRMINRWVIPIKAMDDYVENDCSIVDTNTRIEVNNSGGYCRGCGRPYTDATRDTRLICNNKAVNREFGYPVTLCIDCYWYIRSTKNQPVPRPIREVIRSGFTPKNIVHLIEEEKNEGKKE